MLSSPTRRARLFEIPVMSVAIFVLFHITLVRSQSLLIIQWCCQLLFVTFNSPCRQKWLRFSRDVSFWLPKGFAEVLTDSNKLVSAFKFIAFKRNKTLVQEVDWTDDTIKTNLARQTLLIYKCEPTQVNALHNFIANNHKVVWFINPIKSGWLMDSLHLSSCD